MYRGVVKHALRLGLLVAFVLIVSACEETSGEPNILFILADDVKATDLKPMPKTQKLLGNQGVKFTKAFVTRSLCCPSRASILRGQYSHNHQIWGTRQPLGGFTKFRHLGHERSTVATWLDNAGYDTILIGKYLNGYGFDRKGNYAPTTHVPPGWDRWHGWQGTYYSPDAYLINDNGRIVVYQRPQIHDTDLHAQSAESFIRRTAGGAPFFMHLSPNTPHYPACFADRHASMFSDEPLPKPPSFNEADVSDKPQWVQNKPRLSSTQVTKMTRFHRDRLRALQSLDEMVGRLVSALRDTGELSNTYIVFTTDNGIYLGEHRLRAKAAAYEQAIRVPLLVRGPAVPQGVTRSQMVLNNDLAPTFANLAGVRPPAFVDGRSLSPLLSANLPASWRTAFLVEHRRSANEGSSARDKPDYDAVRTASHLYVEYKTGERELYDLSIDPYELTSLHASASPRLLSDLKARLDALKSCAGSECKTVEDGGKVAPIHA
jgi:N-acetylglucosamine-6-sulfatase